MENEQGKTPFDILSEQVRVINESIGLDIIEEDEPVMTEDNFINKDPDRELFGGFTENEYRQM